VTDQDYETAIKRIVDAAPPLTQAQRDRLAALLADGPTPRERAA
jgi:hypothetical protein